MMHWAIDYIGLPWIQMGDGVTSFNCWQFVQRIQREHYGRELPDVSNIDAADDRAVAHACIDVSGQECWKRVDKPQEGDCVLLARSRFPVHVGVWVRANATEGVLHCSKGIGVAFQTPAGLRTSGWGNLSFYRWTDDASS